MNASTDSLQPGTRVRIAERLEQHSWTAAAHMLRLAGAGQEAVIVAQWPVSIGRIGAARLYQVELDCGPTCYYYDDELTPVADPAEDLVRVRAALDAAQAELASLRATLNACRAQVDPEPAPAPERLAEALRACREWCDPLFSDFAQGLTEWLRAQAPVSRRAAAAALEALPEVVQAVAEVDDELRAGLRVGPGETVSLPELARRARLELSNKRGVFQRLREQLCTLADISPDEPAAFGLALTLIAERLASCKCGPRRSRR